MVNLSHVILLSTYMLLAASQELLYEVFFVRHGARSPLKPISEFDSITWDQGLGKLSPSGERQLYLFGRILRDYFVEQKHFLSEQYLPKELYVQSTDYARTTRTAECICYGLYPSNAYKLNADQIKDENIWTPPMKLSIEEFIKTEINDSALPFDTPVIPVTAHNQSYDRLISFASCPKYYSFWDIYYTSPRFKALTEEYKKDLDTINSLYHVNWEKYMKKDHMFNFVDYLIAGEFHGKFPELTQRPQLLHKLKQYFTKMMVGVLTYNDWMKRLPMHSISLELPALFEKASKNQIDRKMSLYVTHDLVLLAFLIGLGMDPKAEIFDDVPFASYIQFELLKSADNQFMVNVTYNGEQIMMKTLPDFSSLLTKAGRLDISYEKDCVL